MEKEVLIAVIGTVTSIIVALVSLITALLVVRRTAKANQDIERLRLDQEQVRLLLGISVSTFEESLGAVEELCVLIQKCRDEIQILLPKLAISFKQKDSKPILDSCGELITFYSKRYFLFTSDYRMSLHEIKNQSRKIHEILQSTNHLSENISQVSIDLSKYLDNLTKFQKELLEHRDKMLSTISSSGKQRTG